MIRDNSAQLELPVARRVAERRTLPVLDNQRRGTRFIELASRTIANSPESTGMAFWSINPYVGCEFGCAYCYARYAHSYVLERTQERGQLHLDPSATDAEPFEHLIFVKARSRVRAALERDLHKIRRRCALAGPQNVVIGTATDPYQPAERRYRVTQSILERLCGEHGLRIGLITKSPLVTRDIGLLREIGRRNHVSVYVSLISLDSSIIRRFEARSPMPHTRLRALRKLTAAGIRAGMIVAPVLPGITDSTAHIAALVAAAYAAGAHFIFPSVLRLYPGVVPRVLPRIEQDVPALAARYRRSYRSRWDAPEAYVTALKRRFRKVAARYGLPTTDEHIEQSAVATRFSGNQLSLGIRLQEYQDSKAMVS